MKRMASISQLEFVAGQIVRDQIFLRKLCHRFGQYPFRLRNAKTSLNCDKKIIVPAVQEI
jgi:hypothetical protein